MLSSRMRQRVYWEGHVFSLRKCHYFGTATLFYSFGRVFRGRFLLFTVLFLPLFSKTSKLHSALLTQLTNQQKLKGLGCINCGLSLLSSHARCNQVPLESVVSGVPRVLFHLSLFFLSERCIVEHP